MYNGVWSITSPTKILLPGRAATYQFHSRVGKTKIKNGDQWNYVTQTVTFFVYMSRKKPVSCPARVLQLRQASLERGDPGGGGKNAYSQPRLLSRCASSAPLLLSDWRKRKHGASALMDQIL